MSAAPWPEPTPAERERSAALVRLIRERIEDAGGAIDFAEFMDLALNAPGLGYYRAGPPGFGAGGDFTTAPEISPVFTRCLARQVDQILDAAGGDSVLELGAGSGALAAELIEALRPAGRLRRYLIVEVSPVMAAVQRERLVPLARRLGVAIAWLERLPDPPIAGALLANEVADALPVRRFQRTAAGPRPVVVAAAPPERDDPAHDPADGPAGLALALGPAEPELSAWLDALESRLGRPLPPGYVSEVAPAAGPWIEALATSLDRGALLLLDYGYEERDYYHPDRDRGTLLCHYRHRVHGDALRLVGLQDITASVDFSALARAGARAGLALGGYTTPAWFLLGCGLESVAAAAAEGEPDYALAGALRRLLLPGEMGERVKVLALTRGLSEPLLGFDRHDARARL